MCAHIGQKRHIYPPSIFRLQFWVVPPPPFPQVHRGGCYREKFFSFFWLRFRILFFFWFHYQLVLIILRFLFFRFSLVISEVWIEIIFLFFVSPIRFLLVFYFFYFFRFSFWLSNINYRFDSHTSFAWYLLVWFSLYFPRINFDLFQYCRFYALTLQLFISLTLLLVINKHLCLFKFVLCLFWLF